MSVLQVDFAAGRRGLVRRDQEVQIRERRCFEEHVADPVVRYQGVLREGK
jgi:hypothetical protein